MLALSDKNQTDIVECLKDAECILMFLSAMPRGLSVAHICTKTTITSSVNGTDMGRITLERNALN